MPYQYDWALQKNININDYFDKKVIYEYYYISHHPYEYLNKKYPNGKVEAMVIILNNKSIGGVLFIGNYNVEINGAKNTDGII